MNTIILYQSKYGSSKQYAQWLANSLKCQSKTIQEATAEELLTYDTIIHIGSLYAGNILGFSKLKKHLPKLTDKNLVLCMVGMTNPSEQEQYDEIFKKNVPTEYQSIIKPFALRGNQNFSKMSFLHRLLMKAPKMEAEKTPVDQRTKDQQQVIENYGKDISFATPDNLDQVIQYITKTM